MTEAKERSTSFLRQTIGIIVAHRHGIVRAGICALIGEMKEVEVQAEVCDGAELLQLVDVMRPAIVLTDCDLHGVGGNAACASIAGAFPEVKVIMLSADDSSAAVRAACEAGVASFVAMSSNPLELKTAIAEVAAKGRYFSPEITRRRLLREDCLHDALSKRQLQVLKLVALGHSSKEIAFDLGLSSKTVDVHRSRIMDRLQTRDVAGLIRYCLKHRLVTV